jgi:hypothetical protein
MKFLRYVLVGALLSWAVNGLAFTVSFSESQGFGVSDTRVMINNIRVDTEVVNPFDPTRPEINSVYYNVPFNFNATTLHLVPDLGGAQSDNDTTNCASLNVLLTDAFTGEPLSGVMVTVAAQTGSTDVEGRVSFSGLPSGAVEVSAALAGYRGVTRTEQLTCNATTIPTIAVSLSPTSGEGALQANEARIILTWGENPSDLDSHLTGPEPGLAESSSNDQDRFHVWFANRNANDGVANLDVDDVTSFGPETITIKPPTGSSTLRPGIYRYSVHHWSGTGTMSSATVELILGNQPSRFFVPDASRLAGDDDQWTVFELSVGGDGAITVLPVGAYQADMSAGAIRSGDRVYGEPESPWLFPTEK